MTELGLATTVVHSVGCVVSAKHRHECQKEGSEFYDSFSFEAYGVRGAIVLDSTAESTLERLHLAN